MNAAGASFYLCCFILGFIVKSDAGTTYYDCVILGLFTRWHHLT